MASGGWCPVHDRIVPGRRKTCPECGTPLVAMPSKESAPHGPIRPVAENEAESGQAETTVETTVENDRKPVTFGTPAIAAIVTGIVLASFLAGLAIPRHARTKRAASRVPLVRNDVAVNLTRVGAGVRLRLESFSQRGATLILRVAVPDDPRIDTGLIQGVTVAFSERRVELARVLMPTRATPEGFIAAAGVPDLAHAHIDSVRITAMTVGLPAASGGGSGGMIGFDLSGVWPVNVTSAPRTKRVGASVKLDDGRTVRLDALVAWPDHIEARLEVHGQPFNWDYNETYGLAFEGLSGGVGGKVDPQVAGAGVRYIDFQDIAHDVKGGVGLQINVSDFTINGDWTWDLT